MLCGEPFLTMRRLKHLAVIALALAISPLGLAAAENAPASGVSPPLADLVGRLEKVLPEAWRIIETEAEATPIGWTGGTPGLYVMIEDTRTRFFHPTGFHYYSFYRVWLMPPGWEGVMKQTPYVSDSVPAYLLGVSDDHVVFYHTAGGNIWPEGPETLCGALGLERICYPDLTRRIVDLEVEERLTARELESDFVLSPHRIVGLTADGPNLYLEYVFPSQDDGGDGLLAELTDELAGSVFELIPEVESLYLRRCTSDTYTDTIVSRN